VETETCLLDALFKPAPEWQSPGHLIEITRTVRCDGSPFYTVSRDSVKVGVSEITKWASGVNREFSPHRITVKVTFPDVKITDAMGLLRSNNDCQGFPAFGIDKNATLTFIAGFPVETSMPLDCLRKQLILCICLVAEETASLLRTWNKKASPEPEPIKDPVSSALEIEPTLAKESNAPSQSTMNLKCLLGIHEWNGCKCTRCGTMRDKGHHWDGCICSKCGKIRHSDHDWRADCEKCARCGTIRLHAHDYSTDCEKCSKCHNTSMDKHDWSKNCEHCSKCDQVRDESHQWDGCKCARCGQVRDESHQWDGCKCARCGQFRDEGHQWDGCLCKYCNELLSLEAAAKEVMREIELAENWGAKRAFGANWIEHSPQYDRLQKIGKALWIDGGLDAMETVGQFVRNNHSNGYIIAHFWDGIGSWRA